MPTTRDFLADGVTRDDVVTADTAPRGVVLKLALLGVLVVVTFVGLYYVSERVKPVYGNVAEEARLITKHGERFEAVAVGSSHTTAIDFYALNLEGLYLWRGGMDYYQVNYILRTVQDEMPNLKFVFTPADISSYAENFVAARKDRHRETYVLGARVEGLGYLRLLRDGLPIESDWKTLLQSRLWPISRPDSWEGVFERLRNPAIGKHPWTSNGTTRYRRRRERITADSVATRARETATARLEARLELLEQRPNICEIGRTLMDRIADATGPDVTTVFFSHTTYPLYVDMFEGSDRRTERFPECTPAHYAEALDRERDDVLYIDLRRYEPLGSDPARYFANGDHLNQDGASVFSTTLRKRLSERLEQEMPPGHAGRELVLAREADSLGHRYGAAVGQDTLAWAGWRGREVGD